MLKKIILSSLVFLSTSLLINAKSQESITRPKLVIGIVLDQMRWDYLHRFYNKFSTGGFKRLMQDGFNCQSTHINYVPSYTAPGHASIYTGSVPALHGIAGNDFYDTKLQRPLYCTQDDSVISIGGGKAGLQSPKNLLATTITDELRLATNMNSRTYGISIKDRGAILPAGHNANGAFWWESASGNFISSSFYMKQLPSWLINFNTRNITDSLLALNWNTIYPIDEYKNSTIDNNRYEGVMSHESTPTFPHMTSKAIGENRGVIRTSPWGNTIVRMLAESLIEHEQLGMKGYTDFLAVSFSSTDYIGHMYGPNSIEVEDCYYRIDQELAYLLNFLDEKIGKNNYTIFLTADHGGAHNSHFLNDQNINAGIVNEYKWKDELNQLFSYKYNIQPITVIQNYQVTLNDSIINASQISRDTIIQIIKNHINKKKGVSQVIDIKNSEFTSIPDPIRTGIINGHHPYRSGQLKILMEPAWYSSSYPTGTTHGTWNPYDTRIPLLFYGWGIQKGSSFKHYNMTDIAPTIAALLKIQVPNASIGQPILEVLKK